MNVEANSTHKSIRATVYCLFTYLPFSHSSCAQISGLPWTLVIDVDNRFSSSSSGDYSIGFPNIDDELFYTEDAQI